ncbi:DUF3667 domain-containing protein [Erythrobacter sp.]|uniref:DUF3667 domain-containing protein n=1 Tax=Erythrobacter sp. TaxID=1042 RepID=UPI001AFE43A9|nr:DUF3667 domain-containing protein [Erythrobacter sp.]MBO6527760.1 DUF3667 domain-containing protein [Erythrobacter sp.]MBO6529975.1 DUF3667 domain-containing protein [Erythrobacter sp.]
MSDIVEGLGTAVEGGLYAKAVSERPGGTPALDKGHFAEGECLNCRTPLVGEHCHACGQKAHLHRTLSAFMHDVAHGAVHFDSKTWRTLPMLAFKPGELTRRYIDGERTRFVSPMALFLFSIFLMFAIFQFAGISAPTDLQGDTDAQLRELTGEQLDRLEDRRDTLAARAVDGDRSEAERERAARQLAEVEDQLGALTAAQAELPFLAPTRSASSDTQPETESEEPPETPAGEGALAPVTATPDEDWTLDLEEVGWIEAGLDKWQKNPGLMLYKLQTNFYKFSWLLIPLSIPFVWLLFVWKRRFRAYDHAIFVTYSLGFMTMLILALVLAGLGGVSATYIALASMLIPPLHIYKQLRGTYDLSRFSALWRLSVLTVFISIILGLFTSLLMLLGLF